MNQNRLNGNDPTVRNDAGTRHTQLIGLFLVLIVAIIGTIYLNQSWQRHNNSEVINAMATSNAVTALLDVESIIPTSILESGTPSPSVKQLRQKLILMVKASPSMASARLTVQQDGNPVLLLDTATASNLTRSGTLTHEEQSLIQSVFQSGSPEYLAIAATHQGQWLQTFTPVRGNTAGTINAVLGISYLESWWIRDMLRYMIPDLVSILCLFILSVAFYRVSMERAVLRARSSRLSADEALFHSVFDQAPIGISIGADDKVAYSAPEGRYSVNHKFEEILGRSKQELEVTDWKQITHPDDLQKDLALLQRYQNREISGYTIEKRFIRPNGESVWTNLIIGSMASDAHSYGLHLCLLEDITARKRAEEALDESERSKAVLLSHLPGLAYRCRYDHLWTMEFVSEGCEALTGYLPENLVDNRDLSFSDLIAPEYRDLLWNEWARVLTQHRHFRYEYEIITKAKTRKWVLEIGQFIFGEDEKVVALEGIIIDISEAKMREAQITYLNEHDFLTGLNNRVYFEREKQRLAQEKYLPLSVAICDINGVRLINDAFGLTEGDRAIVDVAHLIQNAARPDDVLSRTGGDEFALLMPHTNEEEAALLAEEISRSVDQYNHSEYARRCEISISIGVSTASAGGLSIEQATIDAEEHLNHRKLINRKSSHNSIVSSIMSTLYARSHETEEHGNRLTKLTRMIGVYIGLDQNMLDDLVLLSMLHDIGKVGVDDRILNKPDLLTAEEWSLMKKHSEIGHRIAKSTPELEHIANLILHHHEQWDGTGYPAGLRGEEIPLPSRILAVADAYDAMTEDRVYRRAMPREKALAEIERCAGTQFDPNISVAFVSLMRQGADTSLL